MLVLLYIISQIQLHVVVVVVVVVDDDDVVVVIVVVVVIDSIHTRTIAMA